MKARDLIVALDAKIKETPRIGTVAVLVAVGCWLGWALCILAG